MALQMHGGLGVARRCQGGGALPRDPGLAHYEGASEVQRMIIARDLLKEHSS